MADTRRAETPPPPSSLMTVEQIAEARGHLRRRPDGSIDPTAQDYWLFRAAQASAGWPEGKELSEADYDAAIDAVRNTEVR
jgi:hypothetical protein